MSQATGQDLTLDARVRIMQIIKFALIMGVTAFGAFVLTRNPPARADNSTVMVTGILGINVLFLRLIVPPIILRSSLRRIAAGTWQPGNPGIPAPITDEGRLLHVYQTHMIIGSALLEGGAFANLVSCMLSGHIVSWVLSAVFWLGLMIDFPTRLRVERWLESKLVWIRDERKLQQQPG